MNHLNLPKWQHIAVPVMILLLGMYYFGRYFVADELLDTRKQLRSLEREHQLVKDQLAAESTRATVAEREADVVRKANELLRASERDRQDEIAALQADLAFYRRLGGANGSQAPLAVHYLELQTTNSPRVYRIIFTLTQNLRWAAVIAGNVELGIEGILDGVAKTVTGDTMLSGSAEPMNFRFKYFQQIERMITLPEGFEPSRLSIRLKSNSLRTPVEQSMSWQSLFNKSSGQLPADEEPAAGEKPQQASSPP